MVREKKYKGVAAIAKPETEAVAEEINITPEPPRGIYVLCPSLNRPLEAERLETALAAQELPPEWEAAFNVQREAQPRALTSAVNELVGSHDADVLLVLADHIVPKPGCLAAIARAFEDRFPDFDGMVGLNIANMPPLPGVREYCFFALGREFVRRFPERQVLCPDYHHFYADTELGRYASSIGRFQFAADAEIETFHVNNGLAQKDATWSASRSRKQYDDDTWARRQAAGLLWGATFERVNP